MNKNSERVSCFVVRLAYMDGGVSANTIPACFRHAIRSLIVARGFPKF
jgi:hypothetical protein